MGVERAIKSRRTTTRLYEGICKLSKPRSRSSKSCGAIPALSLSVKSDASADSGSSSPSLCTSSSTSTSRAEAKVVAREGRDSHFGRHISVQFEFVSRFMSVHDHFHQQRARACYPISSSNDQGAGAVGAGSGDRGTKIGIPDLSFPIFNPLCASFNLSSAAISLTLSFIFLVFLHASLSLSHAYACFTAFS